MKTLQTTLLKIGIFFFFAAPLYQFLTSSKIIMPEPYTHNEKIYGDNQIFKNILGVKHVWYDWFPSSYHYNYANNEVTYHYVGTQIETAPWMQKIGCEKIIIWGHHTSFVKNSSTYQIILVVTLRLVVKLLIPFIFIILGITKKRSMKVGRFLFFHFLF